jgi:bacteriorhodopsin
MNPVITCPTCAAENVQESAYVFIGFVVMLGVGALCYLVVKSLASGPDDRAWVFGIIPPVMVVQYVWWRFVTRLTSP